eukprot:m.30532 g.30532  ORF g.30532 m.30532 type:complete len:187 (+) comp12239_c0_seq2:35-595(+)
MACTLPSVVHCTAETKADIVAAGRPVEWRDGCLMYLCPFSRPHSQFYPTNKALALRRTDDNDDLDARVDTLSSDIRAFVAQYEQDQRESRKKDGGNVDSHPTRGGSFAGSERPSVASLGGRGRTATFAQEKEGQFQRRGTQIADTDSAFLEVVDTKTDNPPPEGEYGFGFDPATDTGPPTVEYREF